jgi:pilus assembly protein Flp/PilA
MSTLSGFENGDGMYIQLIKLRTRMQNVMQLEEGQDLIEYALVVAIIAFAATAGMSTVAKAINSAFSVAGTKISTNI